MAASISVAPVAEDRLDVWRSFHTEPAGPKRIEWSQCRRGFTPAISPAIGDDLHLALIYSEAAGPSSVAALPASDDPLWDAERMPSLHDRPFHTEAAFVSPAPGPCKGRRG